MSNLIAGRYELQDLLGRGGTGAAYRVLDRVSNGVLALKRLEAANDNCKALFEREYHTLVSIQHPCVISVYDFGIAEDGRRYYTMELLEGSDLMQLAPLGWREVCAHIRDIATSLALLHARRLVHRDVSPRNVRVDARGRAKLLDFGAVTPFGRPGEVTGTPPCIAPEALHGFELDGRTDLFSLGVVAYWCLTRRLPFALRHLHEAPEAWRVKPPELDKLELDIPLGLARLVMSMLNIDPGGRPATAAEVIDRVVAIADLDEQPMEGLVGSYLSSCALVGREHEMELFMLHIERASRGQGAVVLLEGAAGGGKSRLAAEVSVQASLRGLTSLRVDAAEYAAPGSLATAIVCRLLESAPAQARECLPAHELLFEGFTELVPLSPAGAGRALLPNDPLERRALLYDELAAWLADVARRRPLLLVIDNAHAADLTSATALMAIARVSREAPLLIIATLLRGAQKGFATQQLTRLGSRIRLRELTPAQLGALLRSIFGDVPHLGRLTSWVQVMSAGVPGRALELLSELTERGIIRFASGAWMLPSELVEAELPGSLEDALAKRIAQLSTDALMLARLLALHHAPAPLRLCQRLLSHTTPSALSSTLDELIRYQILVGSQDSYRVRHEGLRKLLLRESAGEWMPMHARLAHAILAELPAGGLDDTGRAHDVGVLSLALQAGWHLLRAGESARGRQILRDAGLALSRRGEGFADALPALQAALAEYERLGLSRYERAYVMLPLALAGIYLDWRFAYRYGEPLIDLLTEAAGFALARRLSRWLGKKLALGAAIACAYVALKLPARRILTSDYRELLLAVIAVSAPVLGNTASLSAPERARETLRRLEPLGWFPSKHILHLFHEFFLGLADVAAGNYTDGLSRTRGVLRELPTSTPKLPPDEHRQFATGVLLCIGSLEVFRTDGSVHRTFEALMRMDSWAARPALAGLRVNYYAGRGESVQAQRYREELDVLAAQAGSTWRQDVLISRNEWWVAALSEDVLGLKRVVRRLEELSVEHTNLAATRDVAMACYMLERGRAAEAVARYGEVFERECHAPTVYQMRVVAAYARLLRAAGAPERARTLCERTLALRSAADREFRMLVHFAEVELALAKAALGERAEAASDLEHAIELQAAHDNALIHGLTRRARAEIALLERDRDVFVRNLTEMESWFKRTDNVALMAQYQRLAEEGRRAGLLAARGKQPSVRPNRDVEQVRRAFLTPRGPAERLQLALELLIEHSGAASGYLYLLEPSGLRFAAPSVGDEPSLELHRELERRLRAESTAQRAPVEPDELETVVESFEERPADGQRGAPYNLVVIGLMRGERRVIVGAAALAPGDEPLLAVEPAFVEEVARGIYDAGDVHTG